MDNRITKKRLYDLFSYDWLKAILIVLGVIIAWEFIYAVASVKLTSGQEFKVFFDQNVYHVETNQILKDIQDKKILSYDVLDYGSENMLADYNLLSTRIEVGEGDIVFTDNKVNETEGEEKVVVRAKTVIDQNPIYSYQDLLRDSKTYIISYFYKNGVIDLSKIDKADLDLLELDLSNIDGQKIESVFRERMKKDNRFRKEAQIVEGIKEEKARIEKLVSDINFFNEFMQNAESYFRQEIFMRYTRYEQSLEQATKDTDIEDYSGAIEREKEQGRENAVYGIDMGVLSSKGSPKEDASSLVKLNTSSAEDSGTANNVIMMVINLKDKQPHLQYETISFIRYIIETYSTFKA